MFTKDDRFYRMVVLILSCSLNLPSSYGRTYKVQDSSEDLSENNSDFSKSPFIFPDYFSKSEEKGFPAFSDEFASSESFPVSNRSSPGYSTVYDGSKSWESNGDERSAKKPILTLFDDWSPEEDERKPQRDYEQEHFPKKPFNPPKIKPGPPYKPQALTPQKKPTFRAPKVNQKPPLNYHYKNPPKPSHSSPYLNEESQNYGPVSFSKGPVAPTLSSYSKPNPNHFSPSFRSPAFKNDAVHQHQPFRSSSQGFKDDHQHQPSFRSSSQGFKHAVHQPSFRSSSGFKDAGSQSFGSPGFKEVAVHQHQFGVNHDYAPRVNIEDSVSFRSKPEPIFVKPVQFKPSLPDPNNRIPIVPKPSDFLSAFTTLVPKKSKKPKGCIQTKKTKNETTLKWMNCYLCNDEKTGRQYERCSDEKPRTKRNVERGKRQYEYDEDYGPDQHEYRFGPEHFVDDAPVEEHQSGETPQETCWKKKKGEMMCIVCENTANGGTYEQCAYGSDPKKNSYERSVSKVYGSPRLPNQERSVKTPRPPPRPPRRPKQFLQKYVAPEYKTRNYHRDVNKPKIYVPDPYSPIYPEQRKYSDIPSYEFPESFPEVNSSPLPDYNEQYDEYEEYPEPEDGQGDFSVQKQVETPSYQIENKAKNFSKNRTSCIKVIKNKMTCFQCFDEKGSKQEECMYVAGEPSNKKMSFREVKEFNYQPSNSTRGKRKFKKHRPDEIIRQTRNTNKTGNGTDRVDLQGEANNVKADYDPIPTDPPDFSAEILTDEHSDETELTFDPHLGLSLPRYMLEKSEHEAIFDEALASG